MKSEFHEFLDTCKADEPFSFAGIQKFLEFAFHENVELNEAFSISLVSPKISRVQFFGYLQKLIKPGWDM
jgi:hypothetical protein